MENSKVIGQPQLTVQEAAEYNVEQKANLYYDITWADEENPIPKEPVIEAYCAGHEEANHILASGDYVSVMEVEKLFDDEILKHKQFYETDGLETDFDIAQYLPKIRDKIKKLKHAK